MDKSEQTKRLRVIRRLSGLGQATKFEENLKLISQIASGKADPVVPRQEYDLTTAARLEAGIASRSPRNAADIVARRKREEEEKKRGKKDKKREEKGEGARDRQEKGGTSRGFTSTEDVNV